MKIAVAGSGGRLGAALVRAYVEAHEVLPLSRQQLDLASTEGVESVLGPLGFDVLINSAALTNVDYCETHEAEAMRVNAEAVQQMAEICERKKARLIHISTDYVFDGRSTEPYREEDPAEPISVYGRSKREGELALLEVSPRHLAVRVSWVFGPDRPSFIDAILKRATESETVEAIGDKYAVPSYTLDIAEHLRPVLADDAIGGLLHVCNGGGCSWREYGEYAIQCAREIGLPMKAETVGSLPMAGMKAFIAERPVYTVMSTGKLTSLTGMRPRSWQDAVQHFVENHFRPPE